MLRLDQLDAYALRFEAPVTGVRAVEGDAGGSWVRLATSAFYPTSGGQAHDLGELDQVPVLDVVLEAGVVWHRVAGPPSMWPLGQRVHGVVDGERRARHRQRHSAQHLLSQAFLRTDARYTTESVSLSGSEVTIDFAGEPEEAQMAAAERRANEAAYAAWPVVSLEVDEGALHRYPLRRPPKVRGSIRLVAMGPNVHEDPAAAWELSACGGTHVRNTAEVAPITLLRSERIRGGLTRVTFRAGWEAWEDHRLKHRVVSRTAAALSTGILELHAKVLALAAEAAEGRRALAEARGALAHERALALRAAGTGPVITTLASRDADLLTPLADALAALGATAAVAVVSEGKVALVLGSGAGVDVRPALQAALPHIGGRGGGRPERAQGAGPQVAGLAAALEAVRAAWT
jgi:alanyl-tRNA synthetase